PENKPNDAKKDGIKADNGDKKAPEKSKSDNAQKQAKQDNNKFEKTDRFEKTKKKNDQMIKQNQQMKSEPVEKLTEPLPVEKWRKIQKNGKWGFYDGFKTVIPSMYDEVFSFKEGLASVELDEKCGYIDSENNIVIPFDYETAMSFSEGYAAVCKTVKFGYINKQGEVVIPFEYDAATPF
ncbi:MAG: WG repeat-containing protein, partial [Clostridia bacterium]|nr:WG repeat-containing protein [Clostridia bacterium]